MFTRKAFLVALIAALGWFMASPTQAAESTLQTILTRGEIIIGTDIPYEPFEFLDDEGNFVGFEIDLAKVMAKELGVKLTFKKAGSFDTIRAELNNGDFDIVLSGMTRTLQRWRDGLATVAADAIGALLNPPQRFFDGLKNLRVGLFDLQLDVHFIGTCGLVGQVTLPCVVFHRGVQLLATALGQNLGALRKQRLLVAALLHPVFLPHDPKQLIIARR